jgi:predicted MFS family arabinose efflux permease
MLPPAILFIFSVMMTSLCTQYYQFMLAQGILGGICCGIMFTPAMAAIGQYFQARRGLAMGIAVSGSSLGGVIFPIALSKMMNESLKFAWSVRIVGFIMLALLAIACATIRRRLPPRGGNILVPSAFKDPNYLLAIAAFFFLVWGMFFPFFYVEEFATSHGMSADLASYMLSILNAASVFGRLLPGLVADRFGNFLTLSMAGVATGILLLCWMAVHTNAGTIVFCIFYGFFSGALVSLLSPCFAQLAPRPNVIGAYLGMALTIDGLAGLTGTPICGALIAQYGWHSAMIFSGVSVLVGSALVCATKLRLNPSPFGKA